MTPEEHQMLMDTRAMVEENTRVLKGIQKMNRISVAMKAIYWFVILGISFGAFYLIQPYVDAVKGNLGGEQTNNQSSSLGNLLKDL